MPAEWEQHQGTWLSWPKDPNTFPGKVLAAVEATYVKMVEALGAAEEVRVLVDDSKMEQRVKSKIRDGVRVRFMRIKTVDVWVRDYGPIYVKGRDMAVVKWIFNAWGGKYDDLVHDNEAGEAIADSTGLQIFRPGMVLEGGSIDVNGAGSALTTEQCLLNANRNPGLSRDQIEGKLGRNLGVHNVIWLGRGIEGDDTDGHVDDIARFVSPRKVVAAVEEDVGDPNQEVLEENVRRLRSSRDQDGRPLDVIELPMPERVDAPDGRLPASYLNFYIGNGAVLVPTFGGRSDGLALRTLEEVFPGRDLVGIDCRALVLGFGTLHCVTQQIPAPGDGLPVGLDVHPNLGNKIPHLDSEVLLPAARPDGDRP
jgi:agmatine deiminase